MGLGFYVNEIVNTAVKVKSMLVAYKNIALKAREHR